MTAAPRMFPVLWPNGFAAILLRLDCPRAIPWALVEPHAAQAMKNHQQSLDRLAERGGLDPQELYFVLHDRPWADSKPWPSLGDAVAHLRSLLDVAKA